MGKQRRSKCRDCERSGNEVRISITGYCPACSERRLLANTRALQAQSGPEYERWLLGVMDALSRAATTPVNDTAALDPKGHSPGSAAAQQP